MLPTKKSPDLKGTTVELYQTFKGIPAILSTLPRKRMRGEHFPTPFSEARILSVNKPDKNITKNKKTTDLYK